MSRLGLCIGIKLPPVSAGRNASRHLASLGIAAAFCSAVVMASIGSARAADWPLRGSLEPGFARWDGWHAGLQAGYANMNTDPGNSTSSLVAFILRNTALQSEFAPSEWTTLAPGTTNSAVYGAFVGYNMQWDNLVLGFDVGYKNPSRLDAGSTESISRRVVTSSDNVQHDVTIDANTSLKLVDYATLRARGGYAIGQFLPYAMVGAAVGRFNYSTTVSVSDFLTQLPLAPSPPGGPLGFAVLTPSTSTAGKDNAFIGGVVAGLGVDWAMTPGLFLRAEWEFIAFASVNGARNNLNTANVGIGLRF
jgi:outer membrane immunogenic protein